MTFVLTIDWLVYLYWVIEHFVFVYSLELRVRSYYEYHERIAQLNKEDCSESVVIPMPVKLPVPEAVISHSVQVTPTDLDYRAVDLFSELQQELGITEEEIVEDQVVYSMANYEPEYEEEEIVYGTYENVFVDDIKYHVESENEDCINIDDLNASDCPAGPTCYYTFASARIADCIDGAQSWVVTVIGMEDSYIHVSDGKRIWVNLGDNVNRIKNGDVVTLDVIRNGKEITVENVFLLETDATADYTIPDEEIYYYQEQQIAI
ncbi:hypothetical protein FAY30_25995 (plasmid) [Bacillus sp. S3]|uniref:hypothetical protein n=1 Tax=Bacillus sp. S3 TaxID=486398 RepID=UPI001187A934|nr:hypothetical protein [Bacillus sp. S3]QCJ45407.1 hypothetical protein FAY30_25995 [Bacillus sp. S3]